MPSSTFKWDGVVGPEGKVEIRTTFPPGTPVEVVVRVPAEDESDDLLQAAESSTGFWDNPIDDEEWNDAKPG